MMLTIIVVSILTGLIFAPLGCLVLWKKYVYFGDGLAHASMLAGIISVIIGIPIFYAGLISTSMFALTIFRLRSNSGNNAAIGLVTSMMIAASLVLSYVSPNQINITKYLVGDIIAANNDDVIMLSFILIIITLFFISSYKNLILVILSKEIAGARKVRVKLLELLFLGILSFSVLSTIKIVGALLVTSVILIPAMIARIIARSPFSMILYSGFFSLMMNFCGILSSLYFDIPFAPTIILSGGVIYLFIVLSKKFLPIIPV